MAISNLLSNAFKYTPAGGEISVCLSRIASDGKKFVEIVVSDTGAGHSYRVTKQNIQLIYHRRYSTCIFYYGRR